MRQYAWGGREIWWEETSWAQQPAAGRKLGIPLGEWIPFSVGFFPRGFFSLVDGM